MKKGLPDRRDACVACGLPVSDGRGLQLMLVPPVKLYPGMCAVSQ